MGITYIIAAVLLVFLLAILEGIYECRHWDNEQEKYVYEDRVGVPAFIYIIIGISFFVPIWNIISYIALMIVTVSEADDEDYYIHIPWLSWLFKKI